MVDENSLDLPSRVTDVLRIFLAATARGEKAELILETRNGRLTTKYRSSETVEGVPATSSTSTKKKKMNPARARRSRLRLEEFKAKKVKTDNIDSSTAGVSAVDDSVKKPCNKDTNLKQKEASNSTQRTVLELENGEDVSMTRDLDSTILHLDGAVKRPCENIIFNFHSEFGEEDILYSFSQIFPENIVTSFTLTSRIRVGRTADHNCEVELRLVAAEQTRNFTWPDMPHWHADVFCGIRRIQ